MKPDRCVLVLFICFLFVLVALWRVPLPEARAEGEEKKKDLPPRAISVAPEFTGIVAVRGEDVSVDLTVTNGGRQDEDIELTLPSLPKGWKAKVKTFSFEVTGVHVASDKSKNLTLRLEPEEGVPSGKYVFPIKAQTVDGKLQSSSQILVVVQEKTKDKEKKPKGVNIVTSYPVLQGPTDAKFEFSVEVESKSDKDAIFNVSAQGPKNWEINFKPAYEDKYISSLRLKANQSQTMAVEVKPHPLAEPGKYPIKVKVSSDIAQAEADLTVVLTGTYKLDAGTPSGLLSLTTLQGKEANMSFYVKNSGSALHKTVRFLSLKPENWKVEFKPEKLDSLAPGDLKQVEVIITPSDQALVGDYAVAVSIEGEKVSKNLELRVTVKASTAWGWVGIGIIVFVIAGLVVLFIRLGRR